MRPTHARTKAKRGRKAGFGGTEALEGDADAARMRREQGYGGGQDMRRDVGA